MCEMAAKYLEQWSLAQHSGEATWKFNKTRQTFLLRFWPHRDKVSSDSFKVLLAYARKMPSACAERTVAQAKEVVAAAEAAELKLLEDTPAPALGEDGEPDVDAPDDAAAAVLSPEEREERRAVLKIQRARALRMLKVLVEPTAMTPSAEG